MIKKIPKNIYARICVNPKRVMMKEYGKNPAIIQGLIGKGIKRLFVIPGREPQVL